MEPEEIKRKAEAFKANGVSQETAKGWFERNGVNQSAWIGFYSAATTEEEKKKEQESSQVSTGATAGTASQSGAGSSASTILAAGQSPFNRGANRGTSIDRTTEEYKTQHATWKAQTELEGRYNREATSPSRQVQEGREAEIGNAIGSLQNKEQQVRDAYNSGLEVGASGNPVVSWGPTDFRQQTGAGIGETELQERQEWNQTLTSAENRGRSNYIAGQGGEDAWMGNADETADQAVHNMLRDEYEAVNQTVQNGLGYTNPDIKLFEIDEQGNMVVDQNVVMDIIEVGEDVERRNRQRLNEELAVTRDLNEFEEVLYDMNTGVRGISSGFQGLYYEITGNETMVEATQYARQMDGFRRTASLMADGLTLEDIELGISGNIAKGEYEKARIIFNTDLAQTAPQIAMQVATTYLTGGMASGAFGLSATATRSVAMTSGAGVMGLNVLGGTITDRYGHVSNTQRYLEGFSAALIETMTERMATGDVVNLLPGFSTGARRFSQQEVRNALFGKGIMSQEFLRMGGYFAKNGAKNFFRNGVEEGLEELVAGVGTEIAFGIIEGRPANINTAELADAFIVGFGAGGGTSMISGLRNPNGAKALIAAAGILSTNYMNLQAARAQAQEDAMNARDEASKAKAEAKVKQLDAMQAQTIAEENADIESMTEEQAGTAVKLYHRIRNAATALKGSNLTEEQRQAFLKDGKKAQAELKALKQEAAKVQQQAEVERAAISNFNFGETGTIEVDETTDAQGSTFVSNIIKVAKALGGTKVMLHKDYDAAAAASGQEKSALMGASGFFKGEDGSIHIVLPAMQSNTAYHEAYHALARNIDPKYMDNFLKAVLPALEGLDTKTKQKYATYLKQYGKDKSRAGRQLLAEEIFAEVNADIADGTITVENAGAALSHNVASVLNSALRGMGIKINKYQSFTDFTNFMAKAAEGMQTGTKIKRFSERYIETPKTKAAKDFVAQIIGARGDLNTQEINALATAEMMLRNGKSMDDVYNATGWYQQHGQWKTEVEYINKDTFARGLRSLVKSGFDAIPLSDLIGADAAVLRVYPELSAVKFSVGEVTRGILNNPTYVEGVTYVESEWRNGDEVGWTDGIHLELDSRVIEAITKGQQGPSLTDAINNAYEVAVHEIQHAVQTIEGFPVGGNNTGFNGIVNKVGKSILNRAIAQAKTREFAKQLYDDLYSLNRTVIRGGLDEFKKNTLDAELLSKVSGATWDIVEKESNAFHLVRAYIDPVDQINNTLDRLFDQLESEDVENVFTAIDDLVNLTRFIRFVYQTEYELTSDDLFGHRVDRLEYSITFQELSKGHDAIKITEVVSEIFKTDNKDEAVYPLGGTREDVINKLEENNEFGVDAFESFIGAVEYYTEQYLRRSGELLDNYAIYEHLAGEVEARNAGARALIAQSRESVLSPIETQDYEDSEQIASWATEGSGYINFGLISQKGEQKFVLTSEDLEQGNAGALLVGVGRQSTDKSETGAGLFEGTIMPKEAIQKRVAKEVANVAALASGGATVMANGKPMSKSGYQVSVFDGSITPLSELQKMTTKELSDWSDAQVAGLLEQLSKYPSSAVGLWVSGGSLFFDVSVNVQDRSAAVALAKENDQLAIYENATGAEIKTKDAEADNILFQINPDALPEPERITVKSGKYGSSVMRKGIPTMTFQEVVKDFRAKNGRDPIVAFWMGDQSGYGTYTLTDGSTTELEGGLGHLINKDNMKAGIAWASNKSDAGIQGVLQNADIVAEVSGHPVKSSRFYKKTVEIMAREFATAWSNSAGKTIKHGKYEIVVPKTTSKNPVDAIKAYMQSVIEVYEADGKNAPANFKNILTEGVKQGNVQYINLSDVDTLEDLMNNERRTSLITSVLGSFENTKANQDALAQLGMPTEEQITDQLRDGYLVENDFQEGDIYAYYAPKRDDNGRVITLPGKHSTYQTDIIGEVVAVAGARQNIFDMIPAYHHLRELKMTGHERVRQAQQNKFSDQDGNAIVNDDIDVAALPNKEVAKLISQIARVAEKRFKAGEITRADYDFYYSGKSGRVSTDVAADLQKMRVMNSQATIVPANAVLATMEAGLTWEQKVEALNQAIVAYKDAGYAAADIKTLLDEFYGEKRAEMGDYNKAGYPSYGHAQSAEGLMFQSGLYIAISEMLASGMTVGQIKSRLIEDGFSAKDATLLVAKAQGYKIGMNQGRRSGRKAANEMHAERMKAQREGERENTKRFREEAKGRLMNMNQINDEMVKLIVELIEKYGNVKVTAAQVKSILRGISATQKKIYKKGMADNGKFALTVVALVDRVADIIEKQYTAQQLAEQNDLLRKVRAKQKALKAKLAKLPKTSRSPLISYFEEVNQMVTLEAGHLSLSSLKALDGALDAMGETTKLVNATVKNGQVRIQNPYAIINGKQVDFRRAKVYFNELLAPLEIEANQYEQALIAADIQNYMDATGADFAAASAAIMLERAEKEMTRYERALKQIAEDLGLDINNVQDLEMALEAMAEEKNEENEARRRAIIDEVVVPTAVLWRNWMAADPDFADIFGLGQSAVSTKLSTTLWMNLGSVEGLSSDQLAAHIEARMNRLSIGQLRRVEFAMFDYIVNGKAYGTAALAAEVTAKNEGRDEMSELDMEAQDTRTKKGGALRNWVFSNLETTPTFFRRIFLNQSESDVAKYMNTLGFSNLRSNTAKADIRHAQVMENINEMLKEYGLNTAYGETALQIYAMVMQKPDKMSDAEWALALRKQFEMATKKDNRYNKKVMNEKKKAIQDFFFGPTGALELSQIQAKLETVDNLVSAWSFIGNTFQVREHLLSNYAETFLGQRFVSEANYIPFAFRRGGDVETLSNQIDNAKTVRTMLDSYSASKMGKRASATFERNPDAIKTSGRYIDLNFFGTIDRTHKENEVKIATARDVAYISEMTSEKNPEFLRTIPSEEVRSDVRQKIYDFLIDPRKTMGDEALSPTAKKWINQGRSMTVLYYFGAVLDQIAKQSAPMWNTLVETKSFDSKLEFLSSLVGQFSAEVMGNISGDMDAKQRLASNFDIAERNVRDAVIQFTGDRPATGDKTRFEKGVDISTKSLVVTDKMVAGASWFAYYKDWHYQNGYKPSEWSWEEAANNPNQQAAEYASLMVSKDQNISTSRDASKFSRATGGVAVGLIKQFMIPFVDFLMNKKMNMMIDVQKMGVSGLRGDALRSATGTVLEVAHFQTMAWMVLAPLYSALGSAIAGALGGGDDEEESWFSEKFSWDMWKRGMYTDLNPYVMPFKMMEDGWINMINAANYQFSDEREKLEEQFGGDSQKAYELWMKTDGIPSFGASRSDADFLFKVLDYAGPMGSIAAQYSTAATNILTLEADVPYYTTSSGTVKYLTTDEAAKLQAAEIFKLSYLTFGFSTGLMMKEVNAATKGYERDITKRATTNENSGLERELAERLIKAQGPEQELSLELLYVALAEEVKAHPQGAKAYGDARVRGLEKYFAEAIIKQGAMGDKFNKHVATVRDISNRFKGDIEVSFALQRVMNSLPSEQQKDFALTAYLYYGIHGQTTIANALKQQILVYGQEGSLLGAGK